MTPEEFQQKCLQYANTLVCYHTADTTFVYISPSSVEMTGYTPEEMIGKTPYDFFYTEDIDYVQQVAGLPFADGQQAVISEYRIVRKDGRIVWFETETYPEKNAEGKNVSLFSITRDITEIVMLREEIEQTNAFFDESGELAKIGAWEIDVLTMRGRWSKVTRDIHEVDESYQISLSSAFDFYPESSKVLIQEVFHDLITNGTPYDVVLELLTARGNRIYVRSIGRAMMRFGKVVKLYGSIQNIQQQIEQENSLKAFVTKLTAQKKQLTEFNQIISHNMRGPIASLSMLIGLIKTTENYEEKMQMLDHLDEVSALLRNMLDSLTKSVNAMNDAEAEVTVENVSLQAVFNDVCTVLDGMIMTADASVTLEAEWDTITYSRMYLESILLNLVENALKYRAEDRATTVTISAWQEAGIKWLSVADNGIGIDTERFKEKIFSMFQTFHHKRTGRGLGLFLVKNQVESMGGEIKLTSTVGQGSVFTIRL